MSGYILRENDPSIVLTADQVDRLVKNGDGDAALLYLLLMRADRGITEQELQSRLRWSQLRLNAAETGLQRLGLIQRPADTPPPAPAEERPVYSAQDLAALLEDDRSFRMLIPQVEEKLGDRARFTTPLLHTPVNTAKTMWMSRRAGLLYIKVYDGGELQLAEAIPAATDTDAAYFFERLDGCFPLKEYELRIAGDNPKAARKLLGKRFRQTTCE